MILLDSNILIEASRPERQDLRDWVMDRRPVSSGITYVETLGYHGLTEQERGFLETFFAQTAVLEISVGILDEAVSLRQQRKMSLGDALIAATALVEGLSLVTRNVKDFRWIDGLTLVEPPGDQPV